MKRNIIHTMIRYEIAYRSRRLIRAVVREMFTILLYAVEDIQHACRVKRIKRKHR